MEKLTSLEICAGAGGQALGLEQAGFTHVGVVELDTDACETLRLNRGEQQRGVVEPWPIFEQDVMSFDGSPFQGVDLLSGGVPCPPFSVAGKQLGKADERDLFPAALDLVEIIRPRAVLLENVRGLSTNKFSGYRREIIRRLEDYGYFAHWQVIQASEHGVPQLRPRFVLVAFQRRYDGFFQWPRPVGTPPTVGETLLDLMAEGGWLGAERWADNAAGIGPTLVGGSKKHGGPDLGPTRAREAWSRLGVKGTSIADAPLTVDDPIDEVPRLTVRMAARLQGFPDSWKIFGRKTTAYRQVGNAFPPPVARALGTAIASALREESSKEEAEYSASTLRGVQTELPFM